MYDQYSTNKVSSAKKSGPAFKFKKSIDRSIDKKEKESLIKLESPQDEIWDSFNMDALPSFLKIDATPIEYNDLIHSREPSLLLEPESNSQFDNLMSKQFDQCLKIMDKKKYDIKFNCYAK